MWLFVKRLGWKGREGYRGSKIKETTISIASTLCGSRPHVSSSFLPILAGHRQSEPGPEFTGEALGLLGHIDFSTSTSKPQQSLGTRILHNLCRV